MGRLSQLSGQTILFFGALVWQWNPDPFGNGDLLGTFAYELRFPGQLFDQPTYLHYNYFRDYPRLGRNMARPAKLDS